MMSTKLSYIPQSIKFLTKLPSQKTRLCNKLQTLSINTTLVFLSKISASLARCNGSKNSFEVRPEGVDPSAQLFETVLQCEETVKSLMVSASTSESSHCNRIDVSVMMTVMSLVTRDDVLKRDVQSEGTVDMFAKIPTQIS